MTSRLFPGSLLLFLVLGILPHLSSAQSTSLNVRLADLSSDLNRLDQIVRSLRLEVEALRRENRQMRDWVEEQLAGSVDRPVSEERMNTVLREYERRIQAANRVSRESLVNEVSQEIETLAEQTQKAINALAKSVEGQPQLEQVVVFSDDYPGSGTSYTVKSGDSLGKIARTHGSKVDWIRNANRLSSDIIYPGQELFIPLEN